MKNILIIIIVIVTVIGIGAYAVNRSSVDLEVPEEALMDGENLMMEDEGKIVENESDKIMEGEENGTKTLKFNGTVLAGNSSPILEYNKADFDALITSDKLVVLYFYANWCPICKEELKSATYPAFNTLTTDRVVGIRINYKDSDTDKDEEDLARKYGIAYQHTKVFVKNGEQILKGPDGWDLNRYLSEINKALAQ